ncbi:MAG: hypothetical protein GY725_11270 [bacterium]|nr:hypothetical protein [bacterium]
MKSTFSLSRWLVPGGLFLLAVVVLPSKVAVWIDSKGHTYLTNRAGPPSAEAERIAPEQLSVEWGGQITGEKLEPRRMDAEEDRYLRAVMAARGDILRGELQAGLRQLRRLLRSHPSRHEAPYVLALVERHRGRLEASRDAIVAVLDGGAILPPKWREVAQRMRGELDEELALANARDQNWETRSLASSHFNVAYDHQFAGREYGEQVVEMLDEVRSTMNDEFGQTLPEPLEVRLYTRAHYLKEHEHRFGFATVGFYDGAIHVVSARRPRNELYALLMHEYSHALFMNARKSHQPFFLNEGIADRAEERARGRSRVSRSEWRRLVEAIRDDTWIPLSTLVKGFGGLAGRRALLAYLESRAAIELIETHKPGAIGRWLDRCEEGMPWEEALELETGWDTKALEIALQDETQSRFSRDPLVRADQQVSRIE